MGTPRFPRRPSQIVRFRIPERVIHLIDRIAVNTGQTRSQIMRLIFDLGLRQVVEIYKAILYASKVAVAQKSHKNRCGTKVLHLTRIQHRVAECLILAKAEWMKAEH